MVGQPRSAIRTKMAPEGGRTWKQSGQEMAKIGTNPEIYPDNPERRGLSGWRLREL